MWEGSALVDACIEQLLGWVKQRIGMGRTVVGRRIAVDPAITAVADNFAALMRSFGRARARLLAAAENDVEWSAHVLLRALANDGPMRAGALASAVQSDPSTVSRQVAALVKEGLLERQADPADGRASLLVPTPRAYDVLAEHEQIRLRHFEQMLEDWSARDLHTFSTLLDRFTSDFDAANSAALHSSSIPASGRAS
jgi:DNA-binding MarR family transcriptional regulator